jgi:hypothetical protein
MSTNSLEAAGPLKPRAVIAKELDVICATWRFGANRKMSGKLHAPELKISSRVMT